MNEHEKMLNELSKLRYEFIDRWESSWEESSQSYTDKESEESVDKLGEEIMLHIREHRDNLLFEQIFEELTKLGQAPCLVYDDNGLFAVTGDGMHEIQMEPSDVTIHCFVEKEQWKPTIREALYHYLDS